MVLRAAQRVVSVEGFDDMLDQTRDRIDEIEGMPSLFITASTSIGKNIHADAWQYRSSSTI